MNCIELDDSIYNIQAIERAVYDLSKEIIFAIKKENKIYQIYSQQPFDEKIFNRFMKLIYDYKIRMKLEAQFLDLRHKIIDRALNKKKCCMQNINHF